MNMGLHQSPRKNIAVRILAMALSVIILVGIAASGAGTIFVQGDRIQIRKGTEESKPVVTVLGTKVLNAPADEGGQDTGVFELGIAVQTKFTADQKGGTEDEDDIENYFKSIGIVLQYDPEVLVPVSWDLPADEETGEIPALTLGEKKWGTQLPVKGSEVLSTATALTDESGLLYIWAESATPQVLYQETEDGYEGTQILALRFTYADGYSAEDVTASNFSNVVFGSGSAVLAFAGDNDAADSPAGQSIWYSGKDAEYENTEYYFSFNANSEGAGIVIDGGDGEMPDYASNFINQPNFILREGVTFYQGGGGGMSLNDVTTILFFDWDDSFLGAIPVGRETDEETVKEKIDGFVKKLYEHYDPAVAPSLLKGTSVDVLPADGSADAEAYPLTSKKGYNFAGWVSVDPVTMADVFTAYAKYDPGNEGVGDNFAGNEFEAVPPNGGWEVTYLKAAYVGNTNLDNASGTTTAARADYTYSDFTYGRIDDNNFTMKFTVSRCNEGNWGVTRLKKMGIRLQYNVGGVTMYMLVDLENHDTQQVEFVVPVAATSFSMRLVNLANATNFVAADVKSPIGTFYPASPGSDDSAGYKLEGWANYLSTRTADQVNASNAGATTANSGWSGITAANFTSANLSDVITLCSTQTGISSGVARNACRNRLLMYQAAVGNRILTYNEMVAAMSMNTASTGTNSLAQTVTPAYLNFRVQTMSRSFEIKGSDLTESQMLAMLVALNTKGVALLDAEISAVLAGS